MLNTEDASSLSIQEQEARFLAALQRMTGLTEVTEDNVRKAMESLTPEQREELAKEGQGLKEELLTNADEHTEELAIFRKEVNERADAADLPIEKDGEHLAKKMIAYMKTSIDATPHIVVLEAITSTPYLVKLALAEARETTARAEPQDLSAIEAECVRLGVPGWGAGEADGRPPFVRRNLLLTQYQLHKLRMKGIELQPGTQLALNEVVAKVTRLLDMLLRFALQNRWVKAVLACTELQGLMVNGLWDHKDPACREAMKEKIASAGLKMPKVSIAARASDVYAGEQVTIKVEAVRSHCYTEEELKAYKERFLEESSANETFKDTPPPDPQEGWWVIGEGLRTSKKDASADQEHNSLVGRAPLACALDQQTMATEISFEAPATPGEYKVMVHLRSTGCIGVDARSKVSFTVKEGSRRVRKEVTEEPPALEEVPELE